MTKTFLVASVAALAIASTPAYAQRSKEERAQARAERAAANASGGGEQRAQARAEARQQRVQAQRPQRIERIRAERPQRAEAMRIERRRAEPRVRVQRAERPSRAFEARRVEERRINRANAFEASRAQAREQRAQRRLEQQQRMTSERPSRQRALERRSVERQVRAADTMRSERQLARQIDRQQVQAQRLARASERLDRRQVKLGQRAERVLQQQVQQQQRFARTLSEVGTRYDRRQARDTDWFDSFAAQRVQSFNSTSGDYFYDYNPANGYLYQVDRDRDLVTALFPVLGGAFSTGAPLPIGYQDYNVPYAYRSLYYDSPDYSYRFGDGAIYRVDPTTQLIQGIVALVTGQRFGVGQMLPAGYDVYNVPFAYRDDYYDSDDRWYRYGDGYIYEVDPFTRRIVRIIPLSYGNSYAMGYPIPTYAGYGGYGAYGNYPSYGVPYGYQSLYYDAPGYNYHYANGGIYQVDPLTRLVTAVVALVTGANLGVGQMLPTGYDVYNVPYAYRDTYFDTQDAWYRYDDGYIYQVDPRTRIVETMIPVNYGGYTVGYPVPAGYAGYDVPDAYEDLYYAEPGYDYRYFDGGIYQVHPDSRVVLGVPALVTGHDLAVGHPLPIGYDVYNVPYAYRDRYVDSPSNWYRYADGNIYQVDPTTRLITAVIDAIV